ncbi:Uncharacterised protein [Mycobacteroides abscessus subsp. massiliense]|uniref:hypothetical protein n=1 Tax=Mycobacteroides abscessus TaxID=36809 RepID=UPI0009A630EC|nr:hypothetical protein [Mycobacteroides abscessus]SLE68114.1 Uncharacterised protein [Mycobacteroides abscessus subsp. massiliense]
MYDPPDSFDDMLGDADLVPQTGPFVPLEIPGVGVVRARRPMPNAVPVLAMSVNAKIDVVDKQGYLTLFLQNHLESGEHERILVTMMGGELPADSMGRVARAIATWGTARPTLPSSRSV